MKKLFSLLLTCLLLALALTASAEGTVLEPVHIDAAAEVASGSCDLMIRFDPLTAFEEAGQMTFTVIDNDLYPTEAVKALQPGDKVIFYGMEATVTSVFETEYGMTVCTDLDACGFELRSFDEAGTMLYTSDTDIPSRTELGTFTLPLAEQVRVRVWQETEPGLPAPELGDEVLASDDLKAFFTARADEERSDWLNCQGEHVTLLVQDGQVAEICVNWGSDD